MRPLAPVRRTVTFGVPLCALSGKIMWAPGQPASRLTAREPVPSCSPGRILEVINDDELSMRVLLYAGKPVWGYLPPSHPAGVEYLWCCCSRGGLECDVEAELFELACEPAGLAV